MKYKNRLSIVFDKKKISFIVVVLAIAIVIVFFLLCNLWTFFLIKILLIIMLCLFLLTFIFYGEELIKGCKPIVIFNSDGIWFKDFDFVPWENVDFVYLDLLNFQPEYSKKYLSEEDKILKIYFKDLSALKKVTFSGKISLFWSKTFKIQHVSFIPKVQVAKLDGVVVDSRDVIKFANKYIKKNKNLI